MKISGIILGIAWYLLFIPGLAAFSDNIPKTYVFVILVLIPPIVFTLFHFYLEKKNLVFKRTLLYTVFFIGFLFLSSYLLDLIDEKYSYSLVWLLSLFLMYGVPIILIKTHHKYSIKKHNYNLIKLCQNYMKSEIDFNSFKDKFEKLYNSGYKINSFHSLFFVISYKLRLESEEEEWFKKACFIAGIPLDIDPNEIDIEAITETKTKELAEDVINFKYPFGELEERNNLIDYSRVESINWTINRRVLINVLSKYRDGEITINDLVNWADKIYYDSWSFEYTTDKNVYDLLNYMANPEITYSYQEEKLDSLLKLEE